MSPVRPWSILAVAFLALVAPGIGMSAHFRIIDCSTCHRSIAEEWSESPHAAAWTSEAFRLRKEGKDVVGESSCACHAPDFFVPEGIGDTPEQRQDTLDTGVDCIACHMDRELTAWSAGGDVMVPHWVKPDSRFLRGEFCAGCHAWGRDSGADCVDCHMPLVRGANADLGGEGAAPGVTRYSHRFPGSADLEMLRDGASLRVSREGDTLRIGLGSLIPMHYFPQVESRRLQLLALPAGSETPFWSEDVRLAPDSSAVYRIGTQSAGSGIRVQLRFYQSPEIHPDSFQLIGERSVD